MNNPKVPRQTFERDQNGSQPRQDIFVPASLADVPYGAPQQPQPQQPSQYSANSQRARKSRKGLVIAIVAGLVLIGGLTAYALLAGGQKPAPKQTTTTDASQSQVLEAAQAIDVEQTNNSLSQDLSRLDDEKDLPNSSLEDTTLGL